MALTGSDTENGCLRVVPGSHTKNWQRTDGTRDKDNLLVTGLGIAVDAVDVILSPGQMSLHHVNIVHGSEPNRSESKRIGSVIRYVARRPAASARVSGRRRSSSVAGWWPV